LWQQLKGKQLHKYSFHRQKPLLNYIADFYCYELKLVLELDGYTHQFDDVYYKDIKKQQELEGVGLTVLRFNDEDVMNNLESVIMEIEKYINKFEKHTPNPSQEGNV
jgi:very-short-patch-repair endonuclease